MKSQIIILKTLKQKRGAVRWQRKKLRKKLKRKKLRKKLKRKKLKRKKPKRKKRNNLAKPFAASNQGQLIFYSLSRFLTKTL